MKVMKSVNSADDRFCVDIFRRADGTWGFEHYRRDVEDGRWFPVSRYSAWVFPDEATVRARAVAEIDWFI
ncbi:hypothetical protein [Roseovarius autotrophicus]|uniref:hypothetical protein n=1 Tax=Roseovarius autotrophicus TaxID=2824121 RepID=UPI001A0D0F07|nr:hypothetical protein [Roseovarius autotrophicus]MBE0452759.1 hypothetical protein [Roseovarius sp.]